MQPQSEFNEMLITSIQNVHAALNQIHENFKLLDTMGQDFDRRLSQLKEQVEDLTTNGQKSTYHQEEPQKD